MTATPDLLEGFLALTEAKPAYERAENFYKGCIPETFASRKVEQLLKKSNLGDLDSINFARLPVDAVADRLIVNAVVTETGGPADDELQTLWQANDLDAQLPEVFHKVCSLGDGYLMVWPHVDEESVIDGIQIYWNSPQTTRVIYDDANPLLVKFTVKAWKETEDDGNGHSSEITRVNLYYDDRIERWVCRDKDVKNPEKWVMYGRDGLPPVLDNPYGQVFFHLRTEPQYGKPEHFYAYGPQAMINKIVMAHLATVDYQSLPQRYGLIDPAVDQSGSGGADFDPDRPELEEADPESPNNTSRLSSDPGAVWLLQGLKGAGQFQAADPDVFLKPFDRYVKSMATVTDTPMHIFDSTGVAISGESRREADQPLIAKAAARQTSFGATLSHVFEFALELLGLPGLRVDVRWKPLQFINDKEGWDVINAKIAAGVPKRQAFLEAGYTPDQLDEWGITSNQSITAPPQSAAP